ncbi:lipase family protein [Kutzneria sp. NPDC051319]|uniref:lipase family protein n=1 Tax=Kutzneria sp. NPDC051319 TaxID=3155047 RepID=UPI003416F59B
MLRRVLVPLLALALVTAPAVAQADPRPPAPAQDPFYTPPTPLPGAAGDLIRQRRVDWYPEPFRVFKAPVQTWLVLYRSTSATGAANAVSGMVLVPPIPWTGPGPRPVLAYAMGTQGLGDDCAPSYHLRTGTEVEIAFLAQAMLKGYAVALTDYEGLGTPGTHTYAVANAEGHALLDVARAASKVDGAGLSADAPVGVFGYSQGGQAAAAAGESQPTYAPDVHVVGIAEGGVPADLTEVAAYNDGNAGFSLVAGAAVGYAAAYPELPFADALNAKGRTVVQKVETSCIVELALADPFDRLDNLTTTPGMIKDPRWQARLAENRLGAHRPAAPVLLYHGTLDELIPFQVGEELRDRLCALGASVQWQPVPLAGHIVAVSVYGTAALNWLGDRFAGRAATPNC